MVRVLCVANQKGGVGKTTTAVNLAAACAKSGRKTLLVDLDPQCNATTGIGGQPTARHALVIRQPLHEAVETTTVEGLDLLPGEYVRVGEQVGKGGQLGQRVKVPGAAGSWSDRIEAVNALIGDLVRPTVEIARVIDAVVKGDLSQRMLVATDGKPRAGVELEVTFRPKGWPVWYDYSPARIQTDREGRFRIEALLPGYEFRLSDGKGELPCGGALRSGHAENLGEVQMKGARE